MGSLKCIGSEFYGSNNLSAPTSSFKLFSSLKSLTLNDMSNLEQWSDPHDHSLQVFPHLQKAYVFEAIKLTRLLDFLNKILSLKKIMLYKLGLNCLPEGLGCLPSLEELHMEDCPNLVSIPSIRGLRSLRNLHIEMCNKLGGSLERLEACAKLESLTIDVCSSIRFEHLWSGS